MEDNNTVIHNLGEKKNVIIHTGCHHEDLVTWVNDTENEHQINHFVGWMVVDESILDKPVPKILGGKARWDLKPKTHMENHPIPRLIIDEDGNESTVMEDDLVEVKEYDENDDLIMIPKTFAEFFWKTHESIEEGKVVVSAQFRTMKGGVGTLLKSDELKTWIEYFGIENIYTKSCYKDLIKPVEEV
jgi:hypothetical protein